MTSIIHQKFTVLDIGVLDMWVIKNELSTLSHQEVIVYKLEDPDKIANQIGTS